MLMTYEQAKLGGHKHHKSQARHSSQVHEMTNKNVILEYGHLGQRGTEVHLGLHNKLGIGRLSRMTAHKTVDIPRINTARPAKTFNNECKALDIVGSVQKIAGEKPDSTKGKRNTFNSKMCEMVSSPITPPEKAAQCFHIEKLVRHGKKI